MTLLGTIDEHRLVPFDLEIAGGEMVTIDGVRAEFAELSRPLTRESSTSSSASGPVTVSRRSSRAWAVSRRP
jgi:hypothetical protein